MKRATKALLVGTVLAWIGWDLAVWGGAPGDTISEVVLAAGVRHPIIPLAFGVLGGHFFWPAPRAVPGEVSIVVLGAAAALVLAPDLLLGASSPYPLAWVLGGLGLGRFAWPQVRASRAALRGTMGPVR